MSSSPLPFERLEVVQLAIANARWVRTTRWPARTASLHDQAMRAADSVVLNLAEGASHTQGNRGPAGSNRRVGRGQGGRTCRLGARTEGWVTSATDEA